jgi:hypothetical protein
MAKQQPATDAVKQIHYLAAALKAPRITEAAARLADQARDAGWTHEDYLAAVLEREVSARNASGAAQRIRWAGFHAVKTLDDFDWDQQPAVRQQVTALASGAFLTEARNVVLLGRPGPAKPTSRRRSGSSPHTTGIGSCSPPLSTGSPGSPTPTDTASCPPSSPGYAATD